MLYLKKVLEMAAPFFRLDKRTIASPHVGIGQIRPEGGPVTRVGFVCKVKEAKIEEYKKHHRQVWPEMLDALRRTGWHNYSLFMAKDGLMFGYFETPQSYTAASEAVVKEKASTRWHEFMLPFFETLKQGENVLEVELEEVFHLD